MFGTLQGFDSPAWLYKPKHNIMKTILSVAFFALFACLMAECDNIAALIISKSIALAGLYLVGKLFMRHCMTEEEINEEV